MAPPKTPSLPLHRYYIHIVALVWFRPNSILFYYIAVNFQRMIIFLRRMLWKGYDDCAIWWCVIKGDDRIDQSIHFTIWFGVNLAGTWHAYNQISGQAVSLRCCGFVYILGRRKNNYTMLSVSCAVCAIHCAKHDSRWATWPIRQHDGRPLRDHVIYQKTHMKTMLVFSVCMCMFFTSHLRLITKQWIWLDAWNCVCLNGRCTDHTYTTKRGRSVMRQHTFWGHI